MIYHGKIALAVSGRLNFSGLFNHVFWGFIQTF
jgi:hypothetical protein